MDPKIAIFASNFPLAESIQEALGLRTYPGCFEDIGDCVKTEESAEVVILAGVEPKDINPIQRLIEHAREKDLGVKFLLLEGESFTQTGLALLESDFFCRLRWPEDTALVRETVKSLGDGHCPTPGQSEVSLEQLLGRQVLAQTPSLLPLVERIALAARYEVTVLINGETGTGKTFLARLIHDHSPRKDRRFLTVSCGAISNNLVESEFFGHVKGAFTGADRLKTGKFAAAGQGTLLLDEIDALGLEQQATLLRVIETGEFEPVGSTETQICKARLIVTSNINLEESVQRGKFRSDLYFRLNVMAFHLPPLRERIEDIALLAQTLLERFCGKYQKTLTGIHPEPMAALETYSWPGNIRQLENVLQNAVLVSSGPKLLLQDLPREIQISAISPAQVNGKSQTSLHQQRDLLEREIIQKSLVDNDNCRSRAAKTLGISRVALYKKLKKFGMMETD